MPVRTCDLTHASHLTDMSIMTISLSVAFEQAVWCHTHSWRPESFLEILVKLEANNELKTFYKLHFDLIRMQVTCRTWVSWLFHQVLCSSTLSSDIRMFMMSWKLLGNTGQTWSKQWAKHFLQVAFCFPYTHFQKIISNIHFF